MNYWPNDLLLATPVYVLLSFLRQWSGQAPEFIRSAYAP
jgi:hypothetical protein